VMLFAGSTPVLATYKNPWVPKASLLGTSGPAAVESSLAGE